MKKNCWFYLCITQSIILSAILLWTGLPLTILNAPKADLAEYLSDFSNDNNYLPDVGYIPDARTATVVGSEIIDKLTGNKLLSTTTVTYDEDNRLWLIEKGYFFRHGGLVIIEQDSGKVVKALLTK